jgi:hypothetical protein
MSSGRVDSSVAGVVDMRDARMRVACVYVVREVTRGAHLSIFLVAPLQLGFVIKRFVDVDTLVQRLEVDLDLVVVQRIDCSSAPL